MTPTPAQTRRAMVDPSEWRRLLLIDTDAGPRPQADVMDDWQAADFEALDPAWQRVAGQPVEGGCSRAYLERPRGHSKTSDIASMVLWALFAAGRQVCGAGAAADSDQAKLLRDAISRLVSLNQWLAALIEVQQLKVVNSHTGSTFVILSADASSSYGQLPDFVVIDEVCHWPKSGEALWVSLFSASAKRANCLLTVISNAGRGMFSSWQWSVRENCRTSPAWHFSRLDGPQASWISPALLEEQRLMLPQKAYARLWLNEWSSDEGDALDSDDIDAAVTQLGPHHAAMPGFTYFAGLDLGIRRDHSALCILGAEGRTQRVRLASIQSWEPIGGRDVDLDKVQQAVLAGHRLFHFRSVIFDPHQCVAIAQRLTRLGLPMQERPFTGANLQSMASATLSAFRDRRIDLYDDPQTTRDIRRLIVVEKQYGFRLESPRDKASGHGDRATALCLCLPEALAAASSGAGQPLMLYMPINGPTLIPGPGLNRRGRLIGAGPFGF